VEGGGAVEAVPVGQRQRALAVVAGDLDELVRLAAPVEEAVAAVNV